MEGFHACLKLRQSLCAAPSGEPMLAEEGAEDKPLAPFSLVWRVSFVSVGAPGCRARMGRARQFGHKTAGDNRSA